jgi:uncharacterized membrane protein
LSRRSGSGSRPTSRSPTRGAARRPAWPHIAGVNIAIFGIVGYLLLLASAFFVSDYVRLGAFAVALGGFGFSIYLTYLEIFKIEAICQWCVASAVLMAIQFLLNAARLIGYAGTDGDAGRDADDREPDREPEASTA